VAADSNPMVAVDSNPMVAGESTSRSVSRIGEAHISVIRGDT
jgi:hypothetical protein